MKSKPTVLCFSGLDPCGGAGIQADIEAISSVGAHPLPLITTLTAQNTLNIHSAWPIQTTTIQQQFYTLQEDVNIDAVKIGLIGQTRLIKTLHELLKNFTGAIVCDPVLFASGGFNCADASYEAALKKYIFPISTLITPNYNEASRLTEENTVTEIVKQLFKLGTKNILITDIHSTDNQKVTHAFFSRKHQFELTCDRLPGDFHGSGCTLSASIASYLAQNYAIEDAIMLAQKFTYDSLKNAFKISNAQFIPNRTSTHR